MKIFILEDDPNRIALFREWFLGHDLRIYDTVATGLPALLEGGPWDMIFLDHDLGGEVYVTTDTPNTGSAFVSHLDADWIRHCRALIVVHSYNPVGASLMFDRLEAMGGTSLVFLAPFGTKSFHRLIHLMKEAAKISSELQLMKRVG